ncbi:MAG: ribonuclease P protein component [Gaiellales bacterium]
MSPPPRRGRLSRAAEFEAVAQLGRSVGGRYVTLRYRRRERPGTARVGFAVPRKVGGAVDRNAVKRRLREAVDRHPDLLADSTDYVVIARPGLAAAAEAQGFDWLCDQVAGLLREAAEE